MTPPRFIPFEAMSVEQQREHMVRCHGIWSAKPSANALAHSRDLDPYLHPIPHTHDKAARRASKEQA